MYKALEHFTDMQDSYHEYNPGDKFPREGLEVSEERLKELSSNENRRGRAMIEIVKEEPEEPEGAEEVPAKAEETVKEEEKPSAPYCIVLASQVKKSNAKDYVERLQKRGYKEASVYIHNKIVRVVYGSFPTEAEAYSQLRKMNNEEEFAEAWVYKKKTS